MAAALTREQNLWRWRILISTYVGYGGYYLTRKVYSICKSSLHDQFNWDSQMLAHIWTAYLLAYVVGQFINSYFGRRWGARAILLTGLAISIGCNFVFGAANSYATFVVFMIINGLVQATGWPGVVGSVSQWIRPAERGTVMGIWGTSYQLGTIMVGMVGGFLLGKMGWRWAFWGCTMLTLGVWWLLYQWQRNKPEDVGVVTVYGGKLVARIGCGFLGFVLAAFVGVPISFLFQPSAVRMPGLETYVRDHFHVMFGILKHFLDRLPDLLRVTSQVSNEPLIATAIGLTGNPLKISLITMTFTALLGAALGLLILNKMAVARQRPLPLDPIVTPTETAGRAVKGSQAENITFREYLEIVLNPLVLIMGTSYFCIKFVRYGLDSWLPMFLNVMGLEKDVSSYYSQIFTVAGLGGAIATGFILDRFLKGRWALLSFAMGLGMVAGCIAVLYHGVSPVSMALYSGIIGFMIYGPDTLLCGFASIVLAGERNTTAVAGVVNGIGSIGPVVAEEVIGWLTRRVDPVTHKMDVIGIQHTNQLYLVLSVFFVCSMGVAMVMIRRAQRHNASVLAAAGNETTGGENAVE